MLKSRYFLCTSLMAFALMMFLPAFGQAADVTSMKDTVQKTIGYNPTI